MLQNRTLQNTDCPYLPTLFSLLWQRVTQSNATYPAFCRLMTEICTLHSLQGCSKDICAIWDQLNCPGVFNFWKLKTKDRKITLGNSDIDHVYLQILLEVSTMLSEGQRRTSFCLPTNFVCLSTSVWLYQADVVSLEFCFVNVLWIAGFALAAHPHCCSHALK